MSIKISTTALANGIAKIGGKSNELKTEKKVNTLLERTDSVNFSSLAEKFDFSTELNNKINEVANDVKKQASIDRKNEIKSQIAANQYIVDVRALAAKLNFSDFDAKI